MEFINPSGEVARFVGPEQSKLANIYSITGLQEEPSAPVEIDGRLFAFQDELFVKLTKHMPQPTQTRHRQQTPAPNKMSLRYVLNSPTLPPASQSTSSLSVGNGLAFERHMTAEHILDHAAKHSDKAWAASEDVSVASIQLRILSAAHVIAVKTGRNEDDVLADLDRRRVSNRVIKAQKQTTSRKAPLKKRNLNPIPSSMPNAAAQPNVLDTNIDDTRSLLWVRWVSGMGYVCISETDLNGIELVLFPGCRNPNCCPQPQAIGGPTPHTPIEPANNEHDLSDSSTSEVPDNNDYLELQAAKEILGDAANWLDRDPNPSTKVSRRRRTVQKRKSPKPPARDPNASTKVRKSAVQKPKSPDCLRTPRPGFEGVSLAGRTSQDLLKLAATHNNLEIGLKDKLTTSTVGKRILKAIEVVGRQQNRFPNEVAAELDQQRLVNKVYNRYSFRSRIMHRARSDVIKTRIEVLSSEGDDDSD